MNTPKHKAVVPIMLITPEIAEIKAFALIAN